MPYAFGGGPSGHEYSLQADPTVGPFRTTHPGPPETRSNASSGRHPRRHSHPPHAIAGWNQRVWHPERRIVRRQCPVMTCSPRTRGISPSVANTRRSSGSPWSSRMERSRSTTRSRLATGTCSPRRAWNSSNASEGRTGSSIPFEVPGGSTRARWAGPAGGGRGSVESESGSVSNPCRCSRSRTSTNRHTCRQVHSSRSLALEANGAGLINYAVINTHITSNIFGERHGKLSIPRSRDHPSLRLVGRPRDGLRRNRRAWVGCSHESEGVRGRRRSRIGQSDSVGPPTPDT